MEYRLLTVLVIMAWVPAVHSQSKIPVIRADSKSVDIRDGGTLQKDAWTISPELKPDPYFSNHIGGRVTFYTDRDSISWIVQPGRHFDFIILLNGKDSAWTRIGYEPSKLEILKNAAQYDYTDKRQLPTFSYQSADAPELVALRKGLKLDSIAGTGPEILKVFNLMRWIHNLIPHDGEHGNPEVKNAMNMIRECRKEQKGLNCRGLAMALNECYLAMDIRSKYITCMPKDSVFNDCHVINMVYSRDAGKWIWIDPSFNAYVMNERGELLGPREVRERLINGKPLILNPDANWNNKTRKTKEEYLYEYMAKNLYRMEVPVSSEYDTETMKPGKTVTYVELLPLDAHNQAPQKSTRTSAKSGITFINYKTNNPDLFWAAPSKP